MSCLTDDPKSEETAALTIKFISFIPFFTFTNTNQVVTVLSAALAAMIASSNNPREALAEVEEYIEDRVALMEG